MDRARDPIRGVLTIGRIGPNDHGLRCCGCGAPVAYVSQHSKLSGTVTVFPYVRLRAGEVHANDCIYSVAGAIRSVVAQSAAATGDTVVIDRHGIAEFRLHVVDRRLADSQYALKNMQNDSDRDRMRREFEGGKRRLSDYLRAATAIARLRALIDDAEDRHRLEAAVRIIDRDIAGRWTDFCYDEDRYPQLGRRLDPATKGRLNHCVAIVMETKSSGPFGPTGGIGRRINGSKARYDNGVDIEVQLFAKDGSVFDGVALFAPYLVVGRPSFGEFESSKNVAIRVMVDLPGQLAQVLEAT